MSAPAAVSPSSQPVRTAIVELRQYTLHPGARDTLIELFDREFVETQEACGISVIGQFRDLDRPDYFVWLRGFADMESRAAALGAFYGGPVWARHRDAANVTMIDSDDVLLLRPSGPRSGFDLEGATRGESGARGSLVAATVVAVSPADIDAFSIWFDDRLKPALEGMGSRFLASFVTEAATNTFPQLPVREGETVFVWFSIFADEEAHARHQRALAASGDHAELERRAAAKPTLLRLAPTARSLLR